MNKFRQALIFLILPFFAFACSSTREIKKLPQFSFEDPILSKAIDDKATKAIPLKRTTKFSTKDPQVIASLKLKSLSERHTLRFDWYDPDGNRYYSTGNRPIEVSRGKYLRELTAWHKLSISGEKAENYPGDWKVNIYLDNDFIASKSFKIEPISLSPPHLVIDKKVVLRGGLSKGVIRGDQEGQILLDLLNNGKGTAFSVWLESKGDFPPGFEVQAWIDIGDIKPGQKKRVVIPVKTGMNLKKSSFTLTVQAKEQFYKNSRPINIKLKTVELEKPILSVLKWVLNDASGMAKGNGNGLVDNGEQIELKVLVQNKGKGEAKDVKLSISQLDSRIEMPISEVYLGTIPVRGQKEGKLCIAFDKLYRPKSQQGDKVTIGLTASDGRGYGRKASRLIELDYRFNEPMLAVSRIQYLDGQPGTASRGNRNGLIEQDELVEMVLEVKNRGTADAEDVTVTVSTDAPYVTIQPPRIKLGEIGRGESSEAKFWIDVPISVPPGKIDLNIKVEEKAFSKVAWLKEKKKVYVTGAIDADLAAHQDYGSEAAIPGKEGPPAIAIGIMEDVDEVPILKVSTSEDRYAVIIGIGTYKRPDISVVRYALADARRFRDYLLNMGGFPKENVKLLEDNEATLAEIKSYIKEWLPKISAADSTVVVYFSGHGVPGETKKIPYLLPYEGNPSFMVTTGYSIEEIKKDLNNLRTTKVALILDTCYVSPEGTRPGLLEVIDPTRVGQMKGVLLTSVKEGQQSNDWPEKGHGLFTYFLLKGIRGAADRDLDGWVDLDEAYAYLAPLVSITALKYMGREQSPRKRGRGSTIRLTRSLAKR